MDQLVDVSGLHFGVLLEEDLLHFGQEALVANPTAREVLGAATAGAVPEVGGLDAIAPC